MKNIDKILNENLKRKYQMNESFERISLIEDDNERFGSTIDYFGKLIDEGYDNSEIETVIDEQFDWLRKLFTSEPAKVSTGDLAAKQQVINTGKSGAMSQFKEFIIRKLLSFIGLKGPLGNSLGTALSEMSPLELISVFRSKQGCINNSSHVAKGVSEALVSYIIETNTEENSIIAGFLRNSLFEYLESEGYTQQLGLFICNAAYNMRNKITQSQPQKITAPTQPLPS